MFKAQRDGRSSCFIYLFIFTFAVFIGYINVHEPTCLLFNGFFSPAIRTNNSLYDVKSLRNDVYSEINENFLLTNKTKKLLIEKWKSRFLVKVIFLRVICTIVKKKVSEVTKHKAMVQSCLLFKAGHSSNLKCSKLCLVLPILTYFKLVLVKLLILGPPN